MTTTIVTPCTILGKEPSISYIYSFIESAEEIRRRCKSEFCRSLIIPEKIRRLENDPAIEAIANIYAIYLAFGHIDYITVGIFGKAPAEFLQLLALYPGTRFVYMTYHQVEDIDVYYYGREGGYNLFHKDPFRKSIDLGFFIHFTDEIKPELVRINRFAWMENMNYLLGGIEDFL